MGWVLLIGLVGTAVALLIQFYWQYILICASVILAITLIVWLVKMAGQAEGKRRRLRREEEAQQEQLRREGVAKAEAHKAKQQSFQTELVKVNDYSLQAFEALPKFLLATESWLDRAEQDFKEGALVPFWDSIEKAASWLGHFDGGISAINRHVKRHGELSKLYKGKSPRFPINLDSVKGMIAGNTTVDRMTGIVRKAHCNDKFASIYQLRETTYEQRKTNQILIAGFTNFAQALDGMGHRIASSIDELSGQVSAMSYAMQESFIALGEHVQAGNQQIVESMNAIHSVSTQNASDVKERHDRALEMMDNIQHRRRPNFPDLSKELGTERY